MKIKDRLTDGKVHISFEVFPPKTDAKFESVQNAVDEIAKLTPSFISVTYGAGGGTSKNTVKIASHIQNELGVDSIAHLTCVSSTKEEVRQRVQEMKNVPINDKEFNRIKKRIYGGYIKEYNDTADIARMFLADFFKEINSFEYLEEMTTINEQYVEQVLKNVFDDTKMVISVIKKA